MRPERLKPVNVREKQLEGDSKALSNMGKKGASHRIQLEDLGKADLNQHAAEEAKLFSVSPEGDVLPPKELETEI